MRIPLLFLPSLLVLLALGAQTAQANDALRLLEKANAAARELNYTGTYVYHHGDHTEVLRVSHRFDKRGEWNKVEVLDGPHREFIRINDEVYCHMSDGKTIRVDKNPAQRFFPAVVPNDPGRLAQYYLAKVGGNEKVAGRDCQVVVLQPRDDYRHTYIFWLDRQTQLPLKAKTIDENGATVSMLVFSEVEIGRQPDIAVFDIRTAGKTLQAASLPVISDSGEHWLISPPPGYVSIAQVMRPMHGKTTPVLHRLYSDGLSNLSVFIEPIVDGVSSMEGLSTESAINIYSRRVGGYKVTTMGEVPAAALLKTANSIQKK